MNHIVLLIVGLIVLTGCSTVSRHNFPYRESTGTHQVLLTESELKKMARESSYANLDVLMEAMDLKKIFEDMARELCTDSCSQCAGTENRPQMEILENCRQETLIVTDFVDLETYVPRRYGILMGELMRGGLTKSCCNRIVQGEFARYFKLTERGFVALTRNANEIKNDEYLQATCVVGTYEHKGSKVLLFAKKIDIPTGRIIRLATREIDFRWQAGSLTYNVR